MTMFRCKKCAATEFKLMLQPAFEGKVDIAHNENQEVVIRVEGKEFLADLMFMNQFAICKECDAINQWEYYFPSDAASSV